jgi:HEAT repeat protein
LTESHFPVRFAAIFALGSRGDASAIPALEALLKSNDLSIEMAPMIKTQIEHLKNPDKAGAGGRMGAQDSQEASAKSGDDQRLAHLEQLVEEMNARLKAIEGRLPPAQKQ